MKPLNSLIAILAVALLAGCAGNPFQPAPPDAANQVAAMLARYQRVALLKPEEQRGEFEAAQAAYERTPNDATRLGLVLALLLPRAPSRDDARVLTLLGAIEAPAEGQSSVRFDLAQLLLGLVNEQKRTQRDDQRKLDQLGHQLREEKRKTDDVQQKLDSLRAIDREMRQRRNEK